MSGYIAAELATAELRIILQNTSLDAFLVYRATFHHTDVDLQKMQLRISPMENRYAKGLCISVLILCVGYAMPIIYISRQGYNKHLVLPFRDWGFGHQIDDGVDQYGKPGGRDGYKIGFLYLYRGME